MAVDNLLYALNSFLTGGGCPRPGALGECPAVDFVAKCDDGTEEWSAALFIWDDGFNDHAAIAAVCHSVGAREVCIDHVLYCEMNGDRAGRTFDGTRAWNVRCYFANCEAAA